MRTAKLNLSYVDTKINIINKNKNKMEIAKQELEIAHAKELSKLAKETVTAKLFDNSDLYLFGSELACYKLAYIFKNKQTRVEYSENLKTFYVAIYKY